MTKIQLTSTDLIIAGATGDLTRRKLIPALLNLYKNHKLPEDLRIIAVAHSQFNDDTFRAFLKESIKPFLVDYHLPAALCEIFLKHIFYVQLDIKTDQHEGWKKLKELLPKRERLRIFYLATSSQLYNPFIEGLLHHNLVTQNSRLALEKPIGHGIESAQKINDIASCGFREDSIFRIDHYLGKGGVQNIFALRAGNPFFEQIWSSRHIASVEITAAESIGVENRHSYYDEAGALRDMVQNHLLQMLCLVGMELPSNFTANGVHDEKINFLKTLPQMDKDALHKNVVRGQYTQGTMHGLPIPSYLEDMNIKGKSNTETYVALRLQPKTKRWKNTFFYLRTGKRLPVKSTEIVIHFRPNQPTLLRPNLPSCLVIQIAPRNLITLTLAIKDPHSDQLRLKNSTLEMDYDVVCDQDRKHSYENILLEIFKGDTALFPHREEVDLSWQWIDNILNHWKGDPSPVPLYEAGSWGPQQAQQLLKQDGQKWFEAINI